MSEVAGDAERAVDDHADRGVDSTCWSFVLRAHLHLCYVRHITSRIQGPLSCLWITPHDGCALLDSLCGLCESFASTIIMPGSFWSFLNIFFCWQLLLASNVCYIICAQGLCLTQQCSLMHFASDDFEYLSRFARPTRSVITCWRVTQLCDL